MKICVRFRQTENCWKSIQTFDKFTNVLYDSAWKSQVLSGLMMPSMMFIGNLGYVVVAILGGELTIRGTISVDTRTEVLIQRAMDNLMVI